MASRAMRSDSSMAARREPEELPEPAMAAANDLTSSLRRRCAEPVPGGIAALSSRAASRWWEGRERRLAAPSHASGCREGFVLRTVPGPVFFRTAGARGMDWVRCGEAAVYGT